MGEKLALNKSTLNREAKKLRAYRQFVPALDLKRKQLMAARVSVRQQLSEQQTELEEVRAFVRRELPMIAAQEVDLNSLVQLKKVEVVYTNLVGLQLPFVGEFEVEIQQYSKLASPIWFDLWLEKLQSALRLQVEMRVAMRRLALLESGLQKTTQRLNLFDKVLIPQAEKNIRKIRIALSDAERAGVVRAKIAKGKRMKVAMR
jgi:V/A-type H+-transporting ATPase subunit D